MRRFILTALALAAFSSAPAWPGDGVSFAGKSVSFVVGAPSGDGTDATARLFGAYFTKDLPGAPTVVIQNVLGAQGITAANYFVKQAAGDGLLLLMAGVPAADPLYYRKPQARFDPTQFAVVGGVSRGGSALFINKNAEKRLHDKSLPPVIMGSLGGVPRAGMQVAAWGQRFLDWNIKWVVGYPGTGDLLEALLRGEIEMTSTAIPSQVNQIMATGKFDIVSQSGSLQQGKFLRQPAYGEAPLFADLIKPSLKGPDVAESFLYWSAINSIDQWVTLPPKTPDRIVATYRETFSRVIADPAFRGQAKKLGIANFRSDADVDYLLRTLGATPPPALSFVSSMLRDEGLQVD
jgi:tripartite-type tricarboxylate transporter receptor subunit TctC